MPTSGSGSATSQATAAGASDYTDLATVKARLGITDSTKDTLLAALITASARSIDDYCDRWFYARTQTRLYTANRRDELLVDDLLVLTSLATDTDGDAIYETVWAASNYALEPANAPLASPPRPYWRIEPTIYGSYFFPVGIPRGVQVVGSWGFSTTRPEAVHEASNLHVMRLVRRQESPLGVAGSPDVGVVRISAADVDVIRLLAPYRRLPMG